MCEANCDCPICYLISQKRDFCEIPVKLGKMRSCYKNVLDNRLTNGQRYNIMMLVLYARNNEQLAVGHTKEMSDDSFTVRISRTSYDDFTLCFHLPSESPTVEKDEDPAVHTE